MLEPRAPEPTAPNAIPQSAALMIGASALFVVVAALVKLASNEATSMQAVLYRGLFSALPLLAVMGGQRLSPASPRWPLLLARGAVGFVALAFYLWAVTHAHLADVLALQQLSPIFVAFLAMALLGERPRASHWLLASLCLVGAFLVLRPTRGLVSLHASAALVSAFFSAGAYVSVRALTRTEPNARIVFWFSGVSALLALPAVLPDWHGLSLRANLLLVGAGLFAAAAQLLMTAAYRRAPAHLASAFTYASIPLAYLVGVVWWGEQSDPWANLGIGIILVAGVLFVGGRRPRRPADLVAAPPAGGVVSR